MKRFIIVGFCSHSSLLYQFRFVMVHNGRPTGCLIVHRVTRYTGRLWLIEWGDILSVTLFAGLEDVLLSYFLVAPRFQKLGLTRKWVLSLKYPDNRTRKLVVMEMRLCLYAGLFFPQCNDIYINQQSKQNVIVIEANITQWFLCQHILPVTWVYAYTILMHYSRGNLIYNRKGTILIMFHLHKRALSEPLETPNESPRK